MRNIKNPVFAAAFVTLGITSVVAQMLILRELLCSFYGNEFFIGLTLGGWLLWTALGCRLGAGLLEDYLQNKPAAALYGTYLAAAALLVTLPGFIRLMPLLSGLPGEIPNLVSASLISLLAMAPLCLVLGAQFALLSACLPDNESAQTANFGYFYDTAGFALGGLFYGFYAVHANEFHILFLLAALNAATALWLLTNQRKIRSRLRMTFSVCLGAFLVASFSPFFTGPLQQTTQNLRFGGQKLVESFNTAYGNLSVTKQGQQYNFYETGQWTGASENAILAEEAVHLPLAFSERPGRILVFGSGCNGPLNELLKYNPDAIVYGEINPLLPSVCARYLPPKQSDVLFDYKITRLSTDLRDYLKHDSQRFDVILLNPGVPATALSNRFFTLEQFRLLKSHLTEGGLVALTLPYGAGTPEASIARLNRCVWAALGAAFKHVRVLSEDENLLLASDEDLFGSKTEAYISRYRKRGLSTVFFTEAYLRYRLTSDKNEAADSRLRQAPPKETPNSDFLPRGYYFTTLSYLGRFFPRLSRNLLDSGQRPLWLCLALIAAAYLTWKLVFKSRQKAVAVMAGTGFSLMFLQSIFIYSFATFFGNLYGRISVLVTVLVGAMALGTWVGIRYLRGHKAQAVVGLKNIPLGFCLLSLVLALGFDLLSSWQGALLAMSAAAGFIGGLAFPLATHLYTKENRSVKNNANTIYTADLAGACLGIFVLPVILFPLAGVVPCLVGLTVLNLLLALELR
ncbi:MAG: hypothetical protein WCG06_00840 [Candidatus Omnitrophota bacterium]